MLTLRAVTAQAKDEG